jgi:hypothetical protein
MTNLRDLLVDRSGVLRPLLLAVVALLLIGGALALASVGGRLGVAGIAILEVGVTAALLAWAGRMGPR